MHRSVSSELFFEYFNPGVTKYSESWNLLIKAALLIDNAPTHPAADKVRTGAITVMFVPSNATCDIIGSTTGGTGSREYEESLQTANAERTCGR